MNVSTRQQVTAFLMVLSLCFSSAALSCATASPFKQDFIEVRTSNFLVTSSLGELETRAWVRDLELFHAGVLYALGIDPGESRSRPTRVIAFDGRGVTRPFAIRGAAASLIPAVDGPILLVRAAGDFNERITPEIRHQYAHRMLRAHLRGQISPEQPRVLPMWLEEGLARLTGTTEVSGNRVRVGAIDAARRTIVLDWREQNLMEIIQRKSLIEMTEPSRERFDAISWAFVHSMLFAEGDKQHALAAFEGIRRGIKAGSPGATEKAFRRLGAAEKRTSAIYTHLSKRRLRVDQLQVEMGAFRDLPVRPLGRAESNDRLASLALELGRPALAQTYFERALVESSDPLLRRASEAGRALALAQQAKWEDAAAVLFTLPLAELKFSADGLVRLGWAYRLWAEELRAEGPKHTDAARSERALGVESASRIASARRLFRSALEVSPSSVEARVGLAGTSLALDFGENGLPDSVLGSPAVAEPWLAEAILESPGSLVLDLWQARLRDQLGQGGSARRLAEGVYSRTHDQRLRKKAETFFRDRAR